jgi:membrane-bound ClpP family serine protease
MTDKHEMSKKRAWTIVLASLVDEAIILAAAGLALWYFKVKLPLWAMVAIGLVVIAYIFVRTYMVVPSLRRKKLIGAESMVGTECEVVEPLTPDGVVRVGVEYWRAVSVDGEVATGESVEIVRVERLKLEVKRKVP